MFGCSQEEGLRRGPWTLGEDNTLSHYISKHGEGRWNVLARCAGLKRTGKSCRLRWLNYLKPDIKRGNLTPQEQLLILELHSKLGNRWSKIAQHLPGRTDNEIKNYWRTRVQRQARQLNMESSSKRFLEAIRCFWAPRLLDQSEYSPPPSISDTTMNNPLNPVLTEPCNYDHQHHLQQQHEPIYSFKDCSSSNHLLGFESFDIAMYNNETQSTLISDSNYYVETTTLNQLAPMGVGCGDMSALGGQVAEPDWLFNNNMGDGMWNMDDVMWKLDI